MCEYRGFEDLLDPQYVQRALICGGYFSKKIIPIFSSKSFWPFLQENSEWLSKYTTQDMGYVTHRVLSYKNSIRNFSIPHPHSYARLCQCIAENWDEINEQIGSCWQGEPTNVLHARRMTSNPYCIFEMNYSSRIGENDMRKIENSFVGGRYRVKADISSCFPSMYTHSIAWAVEGREKAYQDQNDYRLWFNKLDAAVRHIQHAETNGFPIGPHTSNIISDVILSSVDKNMRDKGYIFIRFIDDYEYCCETRGMAEKFIVDLADQLSKFRLNLNCQKTKIEEFPLSVGEKWVQFLWREPKLWRLEEKVFKNCHVSYVQNYFDTAINISKKVGTAAPLRYAINVLLGYRFKDRASLYLEKYLSHLVILFPYLSDLLDEFYSKNFVENEKKEYLINRLFVEGVNRRLDSTVSRAIYLAMKNNVDIVDFDKKIEEIFKAGDCVSIVAAKMYRKKSRTIKNKIRDFLVQKIDEGVEDQYWPLVYDYINSHKVKPQGYNSELFKELKKKKVVFVVDPTKN